MPITDSDFYMSLMSSASSAEFPENKLSSFINRLARKITLSSQFDWVVGLYQVNHQKVVLDSSSSNSRSAASLLRKSAPKKSLNDENLLKKPSNPEGIGSIQPKSAPKKPTNIDEIVFKVSPSRTSNMGADDFILNMLKESKSPNMYNSEYFKIYTSDETTFSYNKAIVERPPNTDKNIIFTVDDYIEDDSQTTFSVLIPIHSYDKINTGYKEPTIKIYINKVYTAKEIIEKFLSAIFQVFRGILSNSEIIEELGISEAKLQDYFAIRNKFLIKAAKHFVSVIEESKGHSIRKREILPPPSFEMIYLDIIQPRFVGESLNKVIYIFPLELDTIVNQTPAKISYFRLNTLEIGEVSIMILDEFGSLVNILSGSFSTHVGLHFKRILK